LSGQKIRRPSTVPDSAVFRGIFAISANYLGVAGEMVDRVLKMRKKKA
jgi:hypothetical protein